ncbi:mechanosensitive ion channel family protein [Halomonas organivorans]|uniref:Small-conductance mechanosensitive channel n=1 Tax=Halomonas organivorans TaxID=257772 RepID=A0A7W5BVH7_9GAMM|nr:mechanosensitive ion channel domain-containing protein [Halomonas organivorans]MBB3139901.1 small-conductance mechanosensitive channel [Halomonas organivorans]
MQRCFTWILLVVALTTVGSSLAQAPDGEKSRWFELESLNTGLGDPSDEVRRQTPREALRSFLTLTEREDFSAAAHLLNLADLAPDEQVTRGAELARQLASVLRRGDWLEPSDLPSRRDAMIVDPSGQHPMAGQPRRNLLLTSLEAAGQTHNIRLARYRVGEQDPVWLITPDSLSYVSALYAEYGPSWLEDHMPPRLQVPLGELRLWEWIALPIFLLLIGLVGWGVHHLMDWLVRRLFRRVSGAFTGRIQTPMAFIAMAFVARLLLDSVVSFSGVVTTTLRILLIIIMAWGVGMVAVRLLDAFLMKMTQRLVGEIDDTKHRDERKLLTSLYALRRSIILVTVVAVIAYVLSQINLFGTLGMTLVASASVLTVLVGIAGQAVLGNILSSFQVSLAKPIRMGDLIVFEGQWCYVEGIFYTFVRLRSWDERRLIVPIRYFVSQPFDNLSTRSPRLYRQIVLTLHLSADVAELRERFIELAKQEEHVVDADKLECHVTAQRETSLEVSCYLMTRDPVGGWIAENNVREQLLAFIRDEHPEWWPREVVVLSRQDVARGE